MEKVVITGMGVASPLGSTVAGFWRGLSAGESGVIFLEGEEFDGLPSQIGGRVAPADIEAVLSPREARRVSLSSQLAMVAAREAVAQARLERLGEAERREAGIIIGSSIGGFQASDPVFKNFYLSGKSTAFVIPMSMNSSPAANVSIQYGLGGPQLTADAACSSAAHSIGYAFNMIRFGLLDLAITGGADSPFARAVVKAWCAMRVVSQRNETPASACRPFSADRDGLVLGEGAGILVIESERSARRRGAPILAELTGYGASSDSHHITQPSQEGPARAMRKALDSAGLTSEDIDHINAHATATEWNDKNETAAIRQVFGARADGIPVVGTKGALGHSIGASGALELIACVLALQHQCLPPTINYRVPDPDCDLDYVTEGSRPAELRHILSNTFAFGGSNAALIVSAYQG